MWLLPEIESGVVVKVYSMYRERVKTPDPDVNSIRLPAVLAASGSK
jgi:hypothetical protein